MLVGIDRRDTQQKTDDRIGSRSATLAQDRRFLRAGEADEIIDGQEIIDIVPTPDQAELIADELANFRLQRRAIPLLRSGLHQMMEIVEGLPPQRHRLVRIFILQVFEAKADACEQPCACFDCLRITLEQAFHLGGRFQITLAIGAKQLAGFRDRRAFADAGDDIVKRALFLGCIKCVVGREQGNAGCRRHALEFGQPAPVGARLRHRGGQPDRLRPLAFEGAEQLLVAFHRDEEEIVAMIEQVFEMENAVALLRAQVSGRQKARQSSPALAIDGIGDDVGSAVGEDEPCPDHEPEVLHHLGLFDLLFLQKSPRPHHPRDTVAVRDADALHAERQRFRNHVGGMRGAAQEAVVGRGDQLGEAGLGFGCLAHAKTPWIYQRGSGFSS